MYFFRLMLPLAFNYRLYVLSVCQEKGYTFATSRLITLTQCAQIAIPNVASRAVFVTSVSGQTFNTPVTSTTSTLYIRSIVQSQVRPPFIITTTTPPYHWRVFVLSNFHPMTNLNFAAVRFFFSRLTRLT